jgi:molybdate transport system permease protein
MNRSATGRPRGKRVQAPLPLLLLGGAGALFFVLPFVGLLLRTPWTDLPESMFSAPVLDALRLSIVCSLSAAGLSVLLGLPLAWLLARVRFPGRALLRGLTTLPLVLPPVVGGVALLLALGRAGFVGEWLEEAFGIRLFGSAAAVIIAETFVAMPFFVLAVEGALRGMDRRYEDAAQTLGASSWMVFWRVTVPLIAPSIGAGAILAWARALGEFGATITFAGNLPAKTQTVPIAVFLQLQTEIDGAIALSLILVVVSLAVLILLRNRWWPLELWREPRA